MLKIVAGLALIVFAFSPLFLSTLFAQETQVSLSISPLIYELTSVPGRTLDEKIKVTNRSESALTVYVEIEDFTPAGEEGEIIIVEEEEDLPLSMVSWMTTTPSVFKLAPNEAKVIDVKIEVPPTADPGGHYGAVLFKPSLPEGAGQIMVASKLATLLVLKVPGESREEANVVSFIAPSFSENGPVDFELTVENTGNVHIRPLGLIAVNDAFGKKVADISIDQKNILPGAKRKIRAVWDEKFLAGRYTANLLAYYGDTNQILTASTAFTVFPVKKAAAVGGVVLGLVVLAWLGRYRIKDALLVLMGRRDHLG